MTQFYTSVDHFALTPAILLALFGCALLLFQRAWLMVPVSLGGLVFAGVSLWRQYQFLEATGNVSFTAFSGSLLIDGFSLFFNAIFLVASALVVIASPRYLNDREEHRGEYYGLLLFANSGMYFLATGVDLVTLLVGLELMALSFYVLVGFLRRDLRSSEAAMKYIILGAFSSGLLAYGFSLFYGLAGSTKLTAIGRALAQAEPGDPVVILALVTASAGLLFKIAAVPFHMWAPDAYEGAPTTVTAYLSVASKAAAFAMLMRLFLGPLASLREQWEMPLAGIALATLTIGNLAAIAQTSAKRLLAYSSIAHAGYLLLGLIAGSRTGLEGVAVYVLVYTFMNIGAFAILIAGGDSLDDLTGLAHRKPAFAVMMVVFLLALAGIPPTAGFLAKYYILLALVETGHWILAIAGAVYVAVSLYYYFRIVRVMFLAEREGAVTAVRSSPGVYAAVSITALATVAIGIFPEWFLAFARNSILPQ